MRKTILTIALVVAAALSAGCYPGQYAHLPQVSHETECSTAPTPPECLP